MLEDENQVKDDGADWEEELDDIKSSSREELVAACAKSVNKLLEEWEGASCEIQQNIVNIPSDCAFSLEIQVHLRD